MQQEGVVKRFYDAKGFGFIVSENGTELFVHFSCINSEPRTLSEGDRVSFDETQGPKGLQAIHVVKIS